MRKTWLLATMMLGLVGCAASTMPGPGQVFPGAIVTNVVGPGTLNAGDVYRAYPDSFVAIGLVEGKASSSSVLGLFSSGDSGYRAAIDDAKRKAGADAIIDCVADVKQSGFLFLFAKSTTIVRGLAIKRK